MTPFAIPVRWASDHDPEAPPDRLVCARCGCSHDRVCPVLALCCTLDILEPPDDKVRELLLWENPQA